MNNQADIRISIIVACRNEIRHIRPLVDSLLAQDFGGMNWEAVIADGMSTDGTRESLDHYAARHSNLRVISNTGRIVSTGLNEAIRSARGEFILRMDAHTVYAPDYCRRCVETLISTGAANVGGAARTRVTGMIPQAIAAAYHSRFSTGGARFHDPEYEGPADTVPYGCWRKETFARIGMFDENLVRNQDDELNLRLVRSGGGIWQSRAILSWYTPRATFSGLFHQYFQYGFWKVAVIRKHRIPGSLRHLIPAGFALANIVLLLGILITAVVQAKLSFAVAATLWLAMAAAYALTGFIASAAAARDHGGWKTLPFIQVAFATYHFSYGLGFLSGLFWFGSKPANKLSTNSVFARITR